MSIGILNSSLHDDRQFKSHYSHFINTPETTNFSIYFKVINVLKSSNFHNKYVVNILSIDSKNVIGKALLNINKDSTQGVLNVDDIVFTKTQFSEVTPPLNPHQFNYKNYLKKQYIHHQLIVSNSELFKTTKRDRTIYGSAANLRRHIQSKLKHYSFNQDEYAIINALLLGQRQDISKEIYDNYAQAGAIHILAVSGLHVGIILFLLNYLLKPLEFLKRGKHIKISIIVILLWCFAIIAGLSASVTRAVTMFTIIGIAMHYKRPTNIYNTLAISIFILLLFKPNFLFDVGFQLSYLAVLAIVIIQPKLYSIIKPKNKIFNFFWNILTVTLAAQIGVIPLSLYYFHQFPGLFFLSNLVIIPCLGIILGFGILIVVLASVNRLPQFLADAYAWIITTMNNFIEWVSHQEAFVFQNISFNFVQTILSYLLVATILYAIIYKTYKSLISLLVLFIVSQFVLLFNSQSKPHYEFIVFHKTRYTMLGFKNNKELLVHHNLNDSVFSLDKTIINYQVGAFIKNIDYKPLENVYQINTKRLLIIDSISVYKSLSFKPEIVLLQNSPKINLNRMIDSLQPELIISDGSNYKSYQKRWKATCELKKIPFHNTSEKGAYIFKY
jgi:competence protein ComEC